MIQLDDQHHNRLYSVMTKHHSWQNEESKETWVPNRTGVEEAGHHSHVARPNRGYGDTGIPSGSTLEV